MEILLFEVCKALAETFLCEDITDKARDARLQALCKIMPMADAYYKEFHNKELIAKIGQKKLKQIMATTTKADLDLIISGPKIRFDGNKVQPAHPFVIPEEELLAWSRTSMLAPLTHEGHKRFEELFAEVFPDTDIFGQGG